MKVIAGKHKNRNLFTLEGMNTRPTTARNKDRIFNILGPFFDGGTSLDLFGGSGSLTIESLSRGIEKAVITDMSNDAIKIIKKNLELTKEIDSTEVYKLDYMSLLKLMAKQNRKFDLILIDPPFAMLCVDEIISFVEKNDLLAEDGLIMAEYHKINSFSDDFGSIYEYKLLEKKTSKLSFYKHKEND